MKIIYQSFNGKNFDTEEACRDYENNANRNNLNGILYGVLDCDAREKLTIIDKGFITPSSTKSDINYILTNCSLVYLPTFTAKDAFCKANDEYGIVVDYDVLSTGWNIYNDDINDYVPLTCIDSLSENLRDDSIFNRIKEWADDMYLHYKG